MAATFDPDAVLNLVLLKFHTTPTLLTNQTKIGTSIHAVFGTLSFVFVTLLLGYIIVIAVNNRNTHKDSDGQPIFVFTQLGAYVVSLMVADLFQSIAGLIQAIWASQGLISEGVLCTMQGMFFQLGFFATATFSAAIAIHTFRTVVLCQSTSALFVACVIGSLWVTSILFNVVLPFVVQTDNSTGAFYAVAPQWCSISPGYPQLAHFLTIFPSLLSALISSVLYLSIFFYLRGTLSVDGYSFKFGRRAAKSNGKPSDSEYESFLRSASYKMLCYPAVYIGLTLPIVIARASAMDGVDISYPIWAVTGSIVSFMGVANVYLYILTRRVLIPYSGNKAEKGVSSQITLVDPTSPMSSKDKYSAKDVGSITSPKPVASRTQTFNGWSARPPAEWTPPKNPDPTGRHQLYRAGTSISHITRPAQVGVVISDDFPVDDRPHRQPTVVPAPSSDEQALSFHLPIRANAAETQHEPPEYGRPITPVMDLLVDMNAARQKHRGGSISSRLTLGPALSPPPPRARNSPSPSPTEDVKESALFTPSIAPSQGSTQFPSSTQRDSHSSSSVTGHTEASSNLSDQGSTNGEENVSGDAIGPFQGVGRAAVSACMAGPPPSIAEIKDDQQIPPPPAPPPSGQPSVPPTGRARKKSVTNPGPGYI